MRGATPEELLRSVWVALGGAPNDETMATVLGRHAEPHRRYHTATHVMWVLNHVDHLLAAEPRPDDLAVDDDAIRAAALFHDLVYDPRSTTNEVDSAVIAAHALRAVGWSEPRCRLVSQLIEATAGHEATSFEAAVLLDADLAILGDAVAGYQAYVDAVRFEYNFVDDDAWRTGRSAVLRSFLDRRRIYVTSKMFAAREAQARANLTNELETLTTPQQL